MPPFAASDLRPRHYLDVVPQYGMDTADEERSIIQDFATFVESLPKRHARPTVIAFDTRYTHRLFENDRLLQHPSLAFVQTDLVYDKAGDDYVHGTAAADRMTNRRMLNLVRRIVPDGCVGVRGMHVSQALEFILFLKSLDYCPPGLHLRSLDSVACYCARNDTVTVVSLNSADT